MSLLRKSWLAPMGLCVAFVAGAQTYAIDFVATASSGVAMSRAGDVVVGLTGLAPQCPGCLPTFNVPAIWTPGHRQLLVLPAGAAYLSFAGVNAQGWVVGTAMRQDATGGEGYVWVPRADGSGHDAVPIGALPGFNDAMPVGIDDQNRVYGLARTWSVAQDAFVWHPADGIQSLTALGYPADPPLAVSPGGTLASAMFTYRFGDPAGLTAVAPPPAGFHDNTSALTGAVNDDGMRASFLLSTSGTSQGNRYLARYTDAAGWQLLGGPVSSGVRYGVGSVDPAGAVSATLIATGYRAAGPDGALQGLAGRVSPAYGDVTVSLGGGQGDDGSILAEVSIGRSQRLVKLVPVQPCVGNCLRVSAVQMSGRMVSEPGQPPGQCTPGATNEVTARISVKNAAGQPVRGATVTGRFLDDYYLDAPVTLRSNRKGLVVAKHRGPACVGAIALLVEDVRAAGQTLDRTAGQLTSYVIPQPQR